MQSSPVDRGGGPRVFGLSGKSLVTSGTQTQVANFFAGDPNSRTGIRIVGKDLDGDTIGDLITADDATVRLFNGSTIPAAGDPSASTDLTNLFGGPVLGGIYVG